MSRLILWLARKIDAESYFLQRHPWRSWRCRLGVRLERLAFSAPVGWAWRRKYGSDPATQRRRIAEEISHG